jgi:hypothetical protein
MTSVRVSTPARRLALTSLLAGAALVSLLGPGTPAFAAEAPEVPTLVGTHPGSPGISTTPRVYGEIGGISTSVFRDSSDWLEGAAPQVVTAAGEGEPTLIVIFGQANCGGAELGSGLVSEFEGPGVRVTVPPLTTTSLSARAVTGSEKSACSNSIAYRQVEDPPAVPVFSRSSPASPADNNSPRLIGAADDESAVSIFTGPACSGSPIATGNAATFRSTGITVSVGDNTTTTFYAEASWAGLPSGCSTSSLTYQEVTAAAPPGEGGGPGIGGGEVAEPPAGGSGSGGTPSNGSPSVGPARPVPGNPPATPALRTAPGPRANDATPLLTGSAPGADSVRIFAGADCTGQALATPSAAQFAVGVPVRVTPNAEATFSARAVNGAGASRCSDPVGYFEDSTPPATRITFGPGATTRKRVAIFRFEDTSGDPAGTTFVCRFDKRPWQGCQSPLKLPRLKPRAHRLTVRAVDAAGNAEANAQTRHFKVIGGRR